MKNLITFAKHKKKLLADPAVRKHYDELEPEYNLIRSIIDKRLKRNMSQAELARKVGTGQSAISRLELGYANPSFKFLQRVAQALGTSLTIYLK